MDQWGYNTIFLGGKRDRAQPLMSTVVCCFLHVSLFSLDLPIVCFRAYLACWSGPGTWDLEVRCGDRFDSSFFGCLSPAQLLENDGAAAVLVRVLD